MHIRIVEKGKIMKSIYVDNDGNEWLNGGTYTDASLVTMANGETTQKAITDLQARDINTFGTSDKWNGGSYSKGAYTIYNDTLYECIVANSNTVPTNTTYWKKVSLSDVVSKGSIQKISGVSGSGGNLGAIIPYPSGFDINNTFVIGVNYKLASDTYLGIGWQSSASDMSASYALKTTGVAVYGYNSTANKNVDVLIMKI